MNADRLVAAKVVSQLPDRFDKWQALNVADRPADLADDKVAAVGVIERKFLDCIRDVRDHLDCCSKIIPATLLGDDVAIDSAGRDIV